MYMKRESLDSPCDFIPYATYSYDAVGNLLTQTLYAQVGGNIYESEEDLPEPDLWPEKHVTTEYQYNINDFVAGAAIYNYNVDGRKEIDRKYTIEYCSFTLPKWSLPELITSKWITTGTLANASPDGCWQDLKSLDVDPWWQQPEYLW